VKDSLHVPAVSVVMSVFNGEPYLKASVESIINQTFNNFEFIITDDGSVDNTWETLCAYARQDARIILIQNQPNAGVVQSLNKGLDKSKANIIVRQDADDISHPERIQKQLDFLDTHPDYGLVAAVPQPIDLDGNLLDLPFWNATENEEIQERLLENMCLCGPTIMVRRECLEAAGFFFSEGLDASEDYDLCLRLAEVTKIASLEGSLYLYRQHPDSASNKRAQQQMTNKAIALERAVYRRYGKNQPQGLVAMVARDYLHAAVIGVARQDLDASRESLKRALELDPSLLESDQPLEELIRAYTPNGSADTALLYTESMFNDLLPKTRQLTRMKFRLLSYIHMSEVFTGARKSQHERINAHLWRGLRYQPTLLLNRGVATILVKDILGKIGPGTEK